MNEVALELQIVQSDQRIHRLQSQLKDVRQSSIGATPEGLFNEMQLHSLLHSFPNRRTKRDQKKKKKVKEREKKTETKKKRTKQKHTHTHKKQQKKFRKRKKKKLTNKHDKKKKNYQ